jgi:hypothetical protein
MPDRRVKLRCRFISLTIGKVAGMKPGNCSDGVKRDAVHQTMLKDEIRRSGARLWLFSITKCLGHPPKQ